MVDESKRCGFEFDVRRRQLLNPGPRSNDQTLLNLLKRANGDNTTSA
jgi:hypothetical protein